MTVWNFFSPKKLRYTSCTENIVFCWPPSMILHLFCRRSFVLPSQKLFTITKPLTCCLQDVSGRSTEPIQHFLPVGAFWEEGFRHFVILRMHLLWTMCNETEIFLLIEHRTRFVAWQLREVWHTVVSVVTVSLTVVCFQNLGEAMEEQ